MSHQFEEWIEEFDEGSLPQTQKQEIERHLQGCASCRQQLDLIQWSKQITRLGVEGAPELIPSPWFAQRVAARINQEQATVFSFWNPMVRMAQRIIPLLTILALVLGIFAYKQVFQLPSSTTDEAVLSAYLDPTSKWKDDLLYSTYDQSGENFQNKINGENPTPAPSSEEEKGK
jgi:hypothetical protein